MTVPRLALEVWEAIKGEDWVLTNDREKIFVTLVLKIGKVPLEFVCCG